LWLSGGRCPGLLGFDDFCTPALEWSGGAHWIFDARLPCASEVSGRIFSGGQREGPNGVREVPLLVLGSQQGLAWAMHC
jgi:hypothetical protein